MIEMRERRTKYVSTSWIFLQDRSSRDHFCLFIHLDLIKWISIRTEGNIIECILPQNLISYPNAKRINDFAMLIIINTTIDIGKTWNRIHNSEEQLARFSESFDEIFMFVTWDNSCCQDDELTDSLNHRTEYIVGIFPGSLSSALWATFPFISFRYR